MLPDHLQQIDRKAGGLALRIAVVVGGVLFGEVLELAQISPGRRGPAEQQQMTDQPYPHWEHP
ncbi:hypothetical protein AERO8C_20140 [Aeromonas veronii]|uniref:Uncharacterized protein n=1 Tax=Aeromonas veronii TaxID=654 RepID=A0A653L245_AERVE|nr:hypothetical protein AERO8C_20140 [Aeromonas veronii]